MEFPDIGGFGVGVSPAVDISDLRIDISYPGGFSLDTSGTTTFDGFIFGDVLGSLPAITGVSLAGSSIAGFSNAQLSFDADHVYINQVGFTSFDGGSTISVDVSFAPVPEPGSALMMSAALGLFGLFGLGRAGRRSRGR